MLNIWLYSIEYLLACGNPIIILDYISLAFVTIVYSFAICHWVSHVARTSMCAVCPVRQVNSWCNLVVPVWLVPCSCSQILTRLITGSGLCCNDAVWIRRTWLPSIKKKMHISIHARGFFFFCQANFGNDITCLPLVGVSFTIEGSTALINLL